MHAFVDIILSENKTVKLNLIITDDSVQKSLLGRNWLNIISLGW